MIKCHALKETDLDRRRRFADHVLTTMTEADLLNTAFSDEATFTMDGMSTPRMLGDMPRKRPKVWIRVAGLLTSGTRPASTLPR